jgi:hypothetical protein
MGDYSYCSFEDGRLCTWGLHHHGFPVLLWDALMQMGYGDTPPEYYGRHLEEHGLQCCKVYMDILSHPVFPDGSSWSTWAIRAAMSDAMEMAAHRLNAPELVLLLLGVSTLDFCWLRLFLTSLLRVVYRKYVSMRHQHKCNAWVQRVICCMIMHDLTILTLISHLLDYPYHF